MFRFMKSSSTKAKERMDTDVDIHQEQADLDGAAAALAGGPTTAISSTMPSHHRATRVAPANSTTTADERSNSSTATVMFVDVPLNYHPGGHVPNHATRRMLHEAGGHAAILRFTNIFYQKGTLLPTPTRLKISPHSLTFASLLVGPANATPAMHVQSPR